MYLLLILCNLFYLIPYKRTVLNLYLQNYLTKDEIWTKHLLHEKRNLIYTNTHIGVKKFSFP